MHRFKSLSALTATWVLVACSSSTKDHSIASIELRPRSVSLAVGASQTLTAVAKDSAGETVDVGDFTWKTSDGDVVEIDDGVVVGMAKGEAEITASADGETSEPSTVTVFEEPKPTTKTFDITLSTSKLPVLRGTGENLTVTLTRSEGFTDDVTITEAGLPEGTVVNSFTFSGDVTETTLVVSARPTAPYSLPTNVQVQGKAGDVAVTKPLTVTVYGKPGVLDTSFAGGSVVVPVGASDDYAYATAVQPDGKVLVAGRAAENLGDFALVRLERDGTLDATFGTGGKVTTKIGERDETAYAIALQKDGKIVLAGTSSGESTSKDFAVARYEANGTLDTTFGTGGFVTTSFTKDADTAYAVVIQDDGKIVVGGDANVGTTGLDFALARYTATGALDTTFGTGGKATANVAAGGARDSIYSLALQTVSGKPRIVAAGGEGDFTVARFDGNGVLDAGFGEGGKILAVNGSTIGAARSVAITKDNELIVAGHSQHDFAVAKFTEAGELDASFGEGGKTVTAVSSTNWDEAQGVAIEASGKIVLGGWVYEGGGTSGNFALVRYGEDGVLDPTFGQTSTAGIVVTDVTQKAKPDEATAVLLQSDERVPIVRVVLAGSASGSNRDFAVTRYFR